MCAARSRCYGRRMRVKRPELGTVLDVGFAVVGVGLTAAALWVPGSLIGTAVTGPPLLLAKLDLRDRMQIAVFAYENGIVRPGRG